MTLDGIRFGILGARADRRGLAVQCEEAARNLRADKVLGLDMGSLSPQACDWSGYDPATLTVHRLDDLAERHVAEWLAGLDVVMGCETFYRPWVTGLCRRYGVATVLQVNPEFAQHVYDWEPLPDVVANPTSWRMDRLDGAVHLPVGVARDRLPFRRRRRLSTALHVIGTGAAADRNGTRVLMAALRFVRRPLGVVVRSQLPLDLSGWASRLPPCVDVETRCEDVGDYARLYDEGDLLVQPRRYGGLCLALGSRITLADGSQAPIEAIGPGDRVRDENGATLVTGTARRVVPEHVVVTVRGLRLRSSTDHIHLTAITPDAPLRETKAEHVNPGDWMLIVRPRPEGITSVEIGPRPVRKGLRNWWDEVELNAGWARIIGLWLAEGFRGLYHRNDRARPQATVCWAFGPDVEHFARETVAFLAERGIHAAYRMQTTESPLGTSRTWVVRCRSLWLNEMFSRLGLEHGAWNKRAPDLDARLVPALVGGWLDGDGCAEPGKVSGYSRSSAMINDLWRLCAKAGVFGSITHGGERLDFNERSAATTAAGWTQRLRLTRIYQRVPRQSSMYRVHSLGWMTRVRSVERTGEPLEVCALETASGRYIAENVLTHNCLPMQEALSTGMPVLMPDAPPNSDLLPTAMLVPCDAPRPDRRFANASGMIDLHDADAATLGATLNRLAACPDEVAALSDEADRIAETLAWPRLEPVYADAFRLAAARLRRHTSRPR